MLRIRKLRIRTEPTKEMLIKRSGTLRKTLVIFESVPVISENSILVQALYSIQTCPPCLNNSPLNSPNATSIIVCGDLNARIGMYTGDSFLIYRGSIFAAVGLNLMIKI